MKRIFLVLLLGLLPAALFAKGPKWQDHYRHDDFRIGERACTVVLPEGRPNGRWIVRPAFLGAFPAVDEALLEHGYTVAYCDVTHAYGTPAAQADFERFYETVRDRYGLSERFIIEGFSRGGFFALTYAIGHPEQIEKIYVDAPVCDLESWPSPREAKLYEDARRQWEACGADWAEVHDYPIRHFGRIVEAGIPVIVCYGEADEIVPYAENFGRIAARYGAEIDRFRSIAKPGCGHHPHSLDRPRRIVRFLKRRER